MKKSLIAILMATTICIGSAGAHPHRFVQAYAYFYTTDSGLDGIYIQWENDPLYSDQILFECDIDENRIFTPAEKKQIRHFFMDQYRSDDYFLTLNVGEKKIPIPTAEKFDVLYDEDDETVTLQFYLSFDMELSAGENLSLGFFDPTSYTAYTCAQTRVSITGPGKISNGEVNRFGTIDFQWGDNS